MHARRNVLPNRDLRNVKIAVRLPRRPDTELAAGMGRRAMMMRWIGAIGAVVLSTPLVAGSIEKACLSSDRNAATREMCACIQEAADVTLNTADQRRAAKFFANPDKAQEVRQSDQRSDEAFWDRYKSFGEMAEAWCAPVEAG